MQYECTKDRNLLHQYYELVSKCYSKDLDVDIAECGSAYTQEEDAEHIIVARVGNYVVGGARLIISSAHSEVKLPLEEEDFLLNNIMPAYALEQKNYCELGRLAVLLDFRGHEICRNILRYSLALAQMHECCYSFWIAPSIQAVYYKKILRKLGVKTTTHEKISFPYRHLYRNIKQRIVLSSGDLTSPDFRQILWEQAESTESKLVPMTAHSAR